jgi:WD40 repeat protein
MKLPPKAIEPSTSGKTDEKAFLIQDNLPGLTLRYTFPGGEGLIRRIAWSPDGRMIAAPADGGVTVWSAEDGSEVRKVITGKSTVYTAAWSPNGQILATGGQDGVIFISRMDDGHLITRLPGHSDWVNALAWAADGTLASGYENGEIRLWDVPTWRCKRVLFGHQGNINGLAWSPGQLLLASASGDDNVGIWDALSGKLVGMLRGHKDWASGVAWSLDGNILVSGSSDATVRIWHPETRRELHVLEGHTAHVSSVSFSLDGKFLASKASDDSVRIWRCDTWRCVSVIHEVSSGRYSPSLAFNPTKPVLATLGKGDRVIRLWEVDFAVLLAGTAGDTEQVVRHTTAKVVLVGDSGVGKTSLGWRLTHGEFKKHSATHGQQFWVLHQLSTRRSDDTECEAILWDLAGQPDYRLIHALFLDEADLSLLLFDPTDSSDPLRSVEYWLRQLKVGGLRSADAGPGVLSPKGEKTPTILVAARCDLGAPTLTREELEAFCRRRGLGGCITTSAKEGEGLEELIQLMKALILWDNKPATVTTSTFKRIKDYVLEWKENRSSQQVIVTSEELRQRLEQIDASWQFTDAEMITAVGHLENYGYVKKLTTSQGETRLLLAPELLNNLAASFVLAARRNEKGLGALEEKRLLAGEYRFPELDSLTPDERDILLDSVLLLFIEHNICFRETDPLSAQSFLVFPELINLNKPVADDGKPVEDGVAYTVSGAIENVYASLVVLLGYTEKFTRTDQWRNHARYQVGNRMVCGFRQVKQDGELEFVLYFSTEVGRPVRQLFQGLFESFLARRNLTATRYEPVLCTKCGHLLERAVVRERIRGRKDFAFCSECGERLALPKMDEPIQLTREQQVDVEAQRRVANMRTPFEKAVFRVQAYVKAKGIEPPECFISYAWGDREQERWVEKNLATDLQKAGITVVLDRWENAKIGASIPRFVEHVAKCDRVVVVGTPLYRHKYENRDPMRGFVVAAEGDLIGNRMLGTEAMKETVLPVLLAGTKETSFPELLHGRMCADFRDERAYFITAFNLILCLYDIQRNDLAVAELLEPLELSFLAS